MHSNRKKILGVIHEEAPSSEIEIAQAGVPAVHQPVVMPTPFFQMSALMQGETPECGGFSLADLIRYFNPAKEAAPAKLSGSYSYAYMKTVDGVPNAEGTTITGLAKGGQLAGSCLLELFTDDGDVAKNPHGTQTPWSAATQAAKADGITRLLGKPVIIKNPTIAQIHTLIETYGGCIVAAELGKEWYTASNGLSSWKPADIMPLRPPGDVIDAHYFFCGAYDETKDQTWFINSWSERWAQNGFNFFQTNYQPFLQYAITFNLLVPPAPAPLPPSPDAPLTPAQLSGFAKLLAFLAQLLMLDQLFVRKQQTGGAFANGPANGPVNNPAKVGKKSRSER